MSKNISHCMSIVNAMSRDDQEALLERLDQYEKMGVPPEKAQKMAAKDALEELKAERRDFERLVAEQHPDETKPEAKIENHDKWSIYQERSAQVDDGYVRWVEDADMAYVTDLQAGPRQRGKALLEWLAEKTGKKLYAVGVVDDASEFWDKMEAADLIEGQSNEDFMSFFGRGVQHSARAQIGGYIAERNKGLSRVNPQSVLDADIALATKAIAATLREIEAGNLNQMEVPVGPIPHVLHMLGAPMQMMQINASIIRKVLVDKHFDDFVGITPQQLVTAIYRPAMVTASRAADEYELVTDLKNTKGQPLTVVIKTNTELRGGAPGGKAVRVAAIMSAYARAVAGGKDSLLERVAGGKVLYAEMEKAHVAVNSDWTRFQRPIADGLRARSIKSDLQLVKFIGDNYKSSSSAKGWDDAPAFSKRDLSAAEAAGFDSSKVWYHGTTADKNFASFKAGRDGVNELGPGIYFTSDPDVAEHWTGWKGGGRIVPALLKRGDLFDLGVMRQAYAGPIGEQAKKVWEPLAQRLIDRNDGDYHGWTDAQELGARLRDATKNSSINGVLDEAGYIGAFNHNSQIPGQVVVFDARNIRSPWAKFNPKKVDSANILHSARDQADTPEFKKWFGKSAVVDNSLADMLAKPDGVRVLINDLLAAQNTSGASLDPVQALMLALSKNDKVVRAIVGLVPIDVVNGLTKNGGRPKDIGGDITVFSDVLHFPVSDKVIESLRGILTSLSAKLSDAIATGRDQEIAPALLASDFNLREVGGLLSLQGSTDFWGSNAGVKSVGTSEIAKSSPASLVAPTKNLKLDTAALADLLNKFISFAPHAKTSINDDLPSAKYIAKQGKPLVVYHGTNKDFTEFDNSKGRNALAGFSEFGDAQGFYFTHNAWQAEAYTTRKKPGAALYPVYLKLENPYISTTPISVVTKEERADFEARGHDGIIWTANERQTSLNGGESEYIVFNPEQIKSAIGNNGNFDGSDHNIRHSIRAGTSAWDGPEGGRFDDFVYKAQNKMVDAKRVIESITKSVGKVAEDINVYLQEELFHGRAAKRVADFGQMELNPLMERMKAKGLSLADVEEFMHARHAEEANAVIAQRNPGDPGMQDGGSGMTNAASEAYFDNLDPALRTKLEDAAKEVDAIIAKTRQLYADYGLESQDTVDSWGQMFQHYVPLQREDKDGSMGIGQGFSVKGKETRGRTGSKRKVVDILANIAMQRERLIVRGEKNRVSQALVGLAVANPNPDFWSVGPPPSERVYDPKTNTVVERIDPMYKSRENVLVAKLKQPDGTVKEVGVNFNEDDPRALRMAQALKNLDVAALEGLMGVSAKITRYFSAINTQYNPVFGVVNLIRDVQSAMLNLDTTPLAKKKGRIARDTVSALTGIYQDMRAARQGKQPTSAWAALWDEFQEQGGQTGYRQMFATSQDRADELQKILTPHGWMESKWGKIFTAGGALKVPLAQAQKGAGLIFDWLSDYNESMENGVRLAAYKAGLDSGMSKTEAASLAKNLTVNFNRKGQIGQQAGAVYAFFNAAMQGTARIASTVFTMEGGDLKTVRLSSTGKKVVYGGMLLGTMQALALAAAGFGDDDPPEFVRSKSLIIPAGGKTYVSIPMPQGFNVIPGLGRSLTEFALSGFKHPAKRVFGILGLFADSFNPIGNAGLSMQTLAPTALDPLVALTENKDFTGKPIARTSSNKALPGHGQYKDTASTVGKLLAEAINGVTGGNAYVAGVLSPTPDQIDYLLGQVTGGVGREAGKVEQSLLGAVRGEDVPLHKIPLVGRFVGNSASQASQSGEFYANINRLNELETEIKGLRKDGKGQEAEALLRERPDAYLMAQANVAERQLQRLRREKREMVERGATREQVQAKEAQMTQVMTRLNQAAEKMREAAH